MRSMKQLLNSGKPALGTFCNLGSVDAVELACHAGFDFTILDGQHGVFDCRGLREAVRAVDAAGGLAVIRIPANGLEMVETLLDAGCTALLAPMVNSPEAAARLVEATHYAPIGFRSLAGCRAGMREGSGYVETFNREFALIVMIEHVAGVERAEEILALPGVAAGFVGPSDLATSLGAGRESVGAALEGAIERALCAGRAVGKPMGIAARDAEEARARARQGFGFVAAGTDRRFLQASFEKQVTAWRA